MRKEQSLITVKSGIKLHFNLKQMRNKEKLTQIMLVTTINKQRIRVYTKLRVEPKYWDINGHCCNINHALTLREYRRLEQTNLNLKNIYLSILQADADLARTGEYLSASTIRAVMRNKKIVENTFKSPIDHLYMQIENYLNNVNRRGKKGIASTQKTYHTALNRLENYCTNQNISINTFEDFNKKFFDGFVSYLFTTSYKKGNEYKLYTQNTITNTLKVIKNLLHRAYDNDLTDNNYYLKVQTTLSADYSNPIYLQEKEIKKLAKVPVANQQEKHIRDMFVISCYTALRISDIKCLNESIIRDGTISLFQTKTREQVVIPILKEIDGLISHYKDIGFPAINACKANVIIKDLAKRCNINEPVNIKEYRGGTVTIKKCLKGDLISFHTARRSCITNLYKRGYPINYIMTLSGHRSIQAFQRYVCASKKELINDFVHLLKKNKDL